MLSIHDVRGLLAASGGYQPDMDVVDVDEFAKMLGMTHSEIWSMRRRRDPDFPAAVSPLSVSGRRAGKLQWPLESAKAFVELYRRRKAQARELPQQKPLKPQKASAPKPVKPEATKRPAQSKGSAPARLEWLPISVVDGHYPIYEGVPIPRLSRSKCPDDLWKHRVILTRPWVSLKVGQSFFVPGSACEKMRDFYGKHCRRFIYLNGVPGMMVWRIS